MSVPQPLNYATPFVTPPPPKRFRRGLLGWLIFVAVAALIFVWLKQAGPSSSTLALSDFYLYQQLKTGNVSSIIVDGDEIDGVLRRPVAIGSVSVFHFRTFLPQGTAGNWTFTQYLLETAPPGTTIRAESANNFLTNFILPFIPWLLILAFIWFFVFRQLRKNNTARTPTPVVIVNPEAR